MRRRFAILAAAAVSLAPAAARAQTTTFTVDRLVMAGAPDDGIGVWRPDVGAGTRFFGHLGLGFALNPLRLDNYVDDLNKAEKLPGAPVTSQLITYLDAGVEILNRASIQVAFPLIVFQAGNDTNALLPNNTHVLQQVSVDRKPVAPMDLRLEGRFIVYRNPSFKLAVSGAVYLPTGNHFSYAGDGAVGASVGFATEYNAKSFYVDLNAAFRLRPSALLDELIVSNEVIYGLGGYVPLRKGTIRVGVELFGGFGVNGNVFSKETITNTIGPHRSTSTGNAGDLDTTPLEWMLNGRMFFTAARNVYAGLGAGTRLTGGYAPDFRAVGVVGASFGVSDTDPQSPGFHYAFNVADEVDTDKDGIPDEIDACPKEPGDVANDPDRNGCPKYIRRISGSAEIEILKQVEFAFDKSEILAVSFPILDEVVRLLRVSPEILLVSIEGHTDDHGKPEYNQKLSDDRAASVMAYLVKKGIDQGRLTSIGYGMTKPLVSNDTPEGRQKNRRVEFKIKSQLTSGTVVVPPDAAKPPAAAPKPPPDAAKPPVDAPKPPPAAPTPPAAPPPAAPPPAAPPPPPKP